jgi:hypothetical protein
MSESVRPDPSRFYRWMVLIFLSIAMFGNYYVYDAFRIPISACCRLSTVSLTYLPWSLAAC